MNTPPLSPLLSLLPLLPACCLVGSVHAAQPQPSPVLRTLLSSQQELEQSCKQQLQHLTPTPELLAQRDELLSMPLLAPSQQQARALIKQLEIELREWDTRMQPYLKVERPASQVPATLDPSDRQPDETQVESTHGLYFDTAASQLSYLGEVQLRDARLHLDCSNGLFIQLEQERVQSEADAGQKRVTGKTPPTPAKPQPQPSDQNATESSSDSSLTLHPVAVQAEQAYLDLHRERLYLRGAGTITLRHERGELHASGGDPSAILSEKEGIFYLRADEITGYMVDEAGARSHFRAKGAVLYLRKDDSITFLRDVHLTHAGELFESRGAMCLKLLPAAIQQPRKGPFASFQRDYAGLSRMGALDHVRLRHTELAQTQSPPQPAEPIEVRADALSYDAQTGETILSGETCELEQQDQRLHARGASLMRWAVDGSLYVRGREIEGDYARPLAETDEIVTGSFHTQRELALLAGAPLLYAPHGLRTQDAYSSLDAKGSVLLSFSRQAEEAKKPSTDADADASSEGMTLRTPPLVFGSLGDVKTLYTEDEITAHHSRQPAFELAGDSALFSIERGIGLLKSRPNRSALFAYEGSRLTAHSMAQETLVEINDKGDLLVDGDHISMKLKQGKTLYDLRCAESLQLHRAQDRLELHSQVQLSSPDLKLASPHRAIITLRQGSAEQGSNLGSVSETYPHLNYNYSGVEEITIPRGTSIQTQSFSMQNEGEFYVRMADDTKRRSHPSMQGVSQLRAKDNVRLLTRSEDKQLLYARGEQLQVDGYTAEKTLTGSAVYLSDGHSAHEVRGNARLHLSAENKATLTGDVQRTRADEMRKQFSNHSKKPAKPRKR